MKKKVVNNHIVTKLPNNIYKIHFSDKKLKYETIIIKPKSKYHVDSVLMATNDYENDIPISGFNYELLKNKDIKSKAKNKEHEKAILNVFNDLNM